MHKKGLEPFFTVLVVGFKKQFVLLFLNKIAYFVHSHLKSIDIKYFNQILKCLIRLSFNPQGLDMLSLPFLRTETFNFSDTWSSFSFYLSSVLQINRESLLGLGVSPFCLFRSGAAELCVFQSSQMTD